MSNKSGSIIISSREPPGSAGFGLRPGKYKIKVKTKSWEEVIDLAIKENVYLAKVDCEGCERYLIDIPCSKLKSIPKWIIETHSEEIEKSILKKFEQCGFKHRLIETVTKTPELVQVHAFEL